MLPSPISLPAAASSLAFASSTHLCVGSDDGSLRLYHLPSPKVVRAVKSLGHEIASIACARTTTDEPADVWLASGRRAFLFRLASPQLIQSLEDALDVLDLGEDDEDALNERSQLSMNDNARHLAFSTDAGAVGTVELSTKHVAQMKTRHSSICGTVKCVPDRPGEIVSGGYDSALLHFDRAQGTLLSRLDIAAPPPSSGVSLSPPFVLATALTPTALFAVGTADGRVWLGGGGEKRHTGKKKRSRKWEGLKEDEGLWVQVAEGPVVALTFSGRELVTCTLLGKISAYAVVRGADGKLEAEQTWALETHNVTKVNAMVTQGEWLVVGGFGHNGKGAVEVISISQDQDVDRTVS
ncbi:hypothetical protein B0H21DRAFT_817842 [Amylocystis lapponica]|nr:hypothetical protein B0H21DRAFT_817842 [Amylocystis lapponica]